MRLGVAQGGCMSDGEDCPEREVLLKELETLKAEQTSRIGFRDNLIYVNLAAVGSTFAFGLSNDTRLLVLLVVPWVCFVLGWTYIVNDFMISRIGLYIRSRLSKRLETSSAARDALLEWEPFHRSDPWRVPRKRIQLCVDLVTFVCSGVVAIVWVCAEATSLTPGATALIVAESLLLSVLAFEILRYSDFGASQPLSAEHIE
jgi:hypothetical protein